MLDDGQIEALRARYGKVGVVDYCGHQLVFRKPSRDDAREYRRKIDNAVEKPDAMDQLAQVTIVAFDGEEDVNRARTSFTTSFLAEYPLAISGPKFQTVLAVLSGLAETEDEEDLGKGVRVKGPSRKPSAQASPNGSGA